MVGAKLIMCYIELIEHGILMGNKVYDGTGEEDKFTMQHDNFYSWMKDCGAAAYLRAMGFEHRQLQSYGANFGHPDWVS